ncbi:class I SAM-dependent DNA methyltransferase [Roseateles chitosanitabidus]|uniref:class I SAM-dependent DNA methyltransferase n=1 Tax=Roseateles chitosanitabidus TaxID=65048 RepID=UPI000A02C61F|nr:class I SAM-dependent methyltransferase [Roseateles chitosanitabidus]
MSTHFDTARFGSMTSSRMLTSKPHGMSAAAAASDIGTMRYYDEHATSYAEATRAQPLHPTFDSFVKRLKMHGGPVLDLGCGAGRDLRALSQRGLSAVGFDASRPLLELATEFSGCPVIQGDLRAIPFENEMFGGVWASASLLHLQRGDIPNVLLEVLRILQVGGYFFSSIKTGEGEGPDSSARWFTYFHPNEWISLVREAGFEVIESQASRQNIGTLGSQAPVAWFDCTARKP